MSHPSEDPTALPSASEATRTFFIGRQPILDSDGRIVAHDLLFRSSPDSEQAVFADEFRATARVLVAAFAGFGVDTLLGSLPGFVNADPRLDIARHADALPASSLVFDIPPGVEVDGELVDKIETLRRHGFRICLDDFSYRDARAELLPYASFAKVDVSRNRPLTLRKIARDLDEQNVGKIAVHVETHEAHRLVLRQGWDLVQGYYFARPETLAQERVSTHRVALLEMIAAIDDETGVGEVGDRLRTVPHLIMNLLSMANLMRGAPAQRIDSLEQALVMVGRSQLLSWLHLLLLASDDEQGCAHPLCRMAAVRGKAMESLAQIRLQKRIGTHELEPSRAALTGMLSLTPALFGMTAKAISQKLGLDYSIEAALMRREGSLGKLLTLRERLEENDLDGVAAMLDELGLTPAELQHSEVEAAAWANGLSAMPTNRAARAARR